MADRKISELTNITGANLADDDEFALVDTSADETKAITFGEFKTALDTATGFVRITGDTMTGNLTVPNVVVSGNVDGRDVSADGTKLDGIEAGADVTDTTNVTAAGALMDSELTNIAAVKALNQGLATTDEPSFDNTTLNAIAATISDTAVDIFVYDTRKDSDGGAWRKRTQGTSWYNETLNTATRGSRKEFPSVAVIVAESNQVTIYDGDDPDLPMWMVFNSASNYFLNEPTVSSVAMLNGKLAVTGTASNHTSLAIGDFVSEFCQIIRSNYDGDATGLVNRNQSFWSSDKGNTRIVNNVVNDVAMTVLPNAPIDAATGLPVPTIAVATDGGVSVIKDDGTVVDSSITNAIDSISFTANNALVYNRTDNPSSVGDPVQVQLTIPTADGFVADQVFSSATGPASNKWNNPDVVGLPDDDFAVGSGTTNIGFNYISNEVNNKTSGMTVQVTSEFNSGWQNGDIKLATLSDTDATNVTGSELVTNGTFDTDSDWTKGSNWSIANGVATTTGANTSPATERVLSQANVLTIGETYTVSVYIDGSNISNANVNFNLATPSTLIHDVTSATNGTYSLTFVATTTALEFRTSAAGAYSGTFDIDNVSVRKAELDRSVNGNGLQVFGTVTKSAVATGADLMAYSGFTSSNYLEQPYNADLDFGTGDFCVMGWFKPSSDISNYPSIIGRISSSNTENTAWTLRVNKPTLKYYMFSGNTTVLNSTASIIYDNWVCLVAVRRNGILYFYINGKLDASGTMANSISNNSARTIIGQDATYGTNSSKLALWRISATAPSPEQIAKIYEDEKHLFQENAQATLYGSSDAVTALAYDDSTELLHVGTSAGRSVFQGLRRVDNTTTAVGAAISASNGLVADE